MTSKTQHIDIKTMTLEEKASLLCGGSFFGIRAIPNCNIPKVQLLDGGTGMNFEQLLGDIAADIQKEYDGTTFDNAIRFMFNTDKLNDKELELRDKLYGVLKDRIGCEVAPGCYPPGIFLGSTWNPEVVQEVGDALGLEAALYGISVLLGTPNVNILKEPRNGRFFEGYSEDPLVTADLGSALVKGVEGRGIAANVKHFAANNFEMNRIGVNEIITERALREIYFPGFKACVDAGCATVMAAYPSINGKNCTENPWLLRDVLRKDWGFKGIVMTDWGACTGKESDSVRSGVDLIMPGPWKYEDIIEAVNDGRLDEAVVDEACTRMISVIEQYVRKAGLPDGVTYEDYIRVGNEAAYRAAAEGIVMLKNRNNSFPAKDGDTFILFGNEDGEILDFGSGSAQVFTSRKWSLKEKLAEAAPNSRIVPCDIGEFASNPDSVALVICSVFSAEGTDRHDIKLPKDISETIKGLAAIRRKANGRAGKIALILNVPGPLELSEVEPDLDGIFCMYYPGMMGTAAMADILLGKVNPSGHLTVSFPVKYEDTPAYLNYPDGYTCVYGEDVFVGYRGYEKRGIKPLYPFGHGLSYTDFKIEGATIGSDEYSMNDKISVTFNLANTGAVDGSAVVQLYVADRVSKLNKPVKELRAFGKFSIKSGASLIGILEFDAKSLASFDNDYGKFLVEDGVYDIYLGFSSEESVNIGSFRITDGDSEYRLGINSQVLTIWDFPELLEILKEDIIASGEDVFKLINNYKYTPFNKINMIYDNASEFTNFIKKAAEYIKD